MSVFSHTGGVPFIFVGGTANKTASGTIADANAGEIVVVNAHGGAILTESTAATATHFKVGLKAPTGQLDIISDIVDKSKIEFADAKLYAAPAQQISYIGYNGTSGSIEANDNEQYYIRLYMEDYFARSSADGKRMKHGVYRSGTSATQEQIATGLVKSLINNFKREAEQQIRFERVCDEAGTAVPTGNANLVFTKGSKYLTTDNVDDSTGATAIAVGDYIRVDVDDATSGTAQTDPIYRVVSIDATNDVIELDIPWQGESVTVEDESAELILSAAAVAAEFGIKMTGVPADFKLGKIKEKIVRWEIGLDTSEGFGVTPITLAQAASRGTGTVNQVAEIEWFMFGNEGERYRMGEPNIFDPRSLTDASVAGGGYDLITIQYVDDSVVGFQANVSKKQILLATPATAPNYAVTGTSDDITDVLEVLVFGSAGGQLALG